MQQRRHTVKKEIKRKLIKGVNHEELVLLKFSIEDSKTKLKWKHAREFSFEAEMYDVVSYEIKSDSIFYRCWWDHEETALSKKLDRLLFFALGQDQPSNEKNNLMFDYYKHLFCKEIEKIVSPGKLLVSTYSETIYLPFNDLDGPENYISFSFPPPETFSSNLFHAV
jgi:hypothetical protein